MIEMIDTAFQREVPPNSLTDLTISRLMIVSREAKNNEHDANNAALEFKML